MVRPNAIRPAAVGVALFLPARDSVKRIAVDTSAPGGSSNAAFRVPPGSNKGDGNSEIGKLFIRNRLSGCDDGRESVAVGRQRAASKPP